MLELLGPRSTIAACPPRAPATAPPHLGHLPCATVSPASARLSARRAPSSRNGRPGPVAAALPRPDAAQNDKELTARVYASSRPEEVRAARARPHHKVPFGAVLTPRELLDSPASPSAASSTSSTRPVTPACPAAHSSASTGSAGRCSAPARTLPASWRTGSERGRHEAAAPRRGPRRRPHHDVGRSLSPPRPRRDGRRGHQDRVAPRVGQHPHAHAASPGAGPPGTPPSTSTTTTATRSR